MIVSLTTIPPRIQHIKPVIESIKRQTKPVTKILLWIPQTYKGKYEYNIPQFLYENDLVEIIRCEDLGPATKFLHTIKELESEEEFVVIDDDQIYSQYLIEDLTSVPFLTGAKSVKGTYWIDHDGKPSRRRDNTTPNKARKWLRHIITKKEDYLNRFNFSTVPIICGCDGILLKPGFFTKDIYDIPKQFFNCDDIWLSGCLEKNKIKKYVVPCRHISSNEWATGGIITDYLTNPIFKPKKNKPHIKYLGDISKINGGMYERVGIYNKAIKN